MMIWFQAGYYLPDAQLVRENYKVQLPELHDLRRFGIYIAYDCRFYATYQLIRDDDFVRGFTFCLILHCLPIPFRQWKQLILWKVLL